MALFHNHLFWRQLPGGVHPHPNLPPEGEGTFDIPRVLFRVSLEFDTRRAGHDAYVLVAAAAQADENYLVGRELAGQFY